MSVHDERITQLVKEIEEKRALLLRALQLRAREPLTDDDAKRIGNVLDGATFLMGSFRETNADLYFGMLSDVVYRSTGGKIRHVEGRGWVSENWQNSL